MKNNALFPLLLLLLSVPMLAQTVSENEAAELAQSFFTQKSGNTSVHLLQAQRSLARNTTPDYYVFAPDAGDGYVLVAGDKASVPVLGYSLYHSFPNAQLMPPGMQTLLHSYSEQLDYIRSHRLSSTPQISALWKNGGLAETESTSPVAPLLHSNWGQGEPFNLQCPTNSTGIHALTGCVATAMAQLMYFWKYPSQTVATSNICVTDNNPFDPTSDVSGTWCTWAGGGYEWSVMKDDYDANSNPGSKDAVAKLMFDCGIGAQMDYGTAVSNATTFHAAYAMDTWFGYWDCPVYEKAEFNSDWKYLLINNLTAGRPMYYDGDNRTTPNGPGTGHAWVVDGYDGGDKFHMNWGWDGDFNDYFLLTDLTPGTAFLTNNQSMFAPVPQIYCHPSITLTGDQSNTKIDVDDWIHTSATLNASGHAYFNAGNEIVLTDGFVAYAGSDFRAFIQGCFGNPLNQPAEDRSKVIPEAENAAQSGKVQVMPNPFSGSTLVTYFLGSEQQVTLQLFDALGKLVTTPMATQVQSEGEHQFTLEAGNLPPGLYFLAIQMGAQRETKRLVLTQ